MRHHQYNPDFEFVEHPVEFDKNTQRSLLQYCLGATLYMPGTKSILPKVLNRDLPGLASMVMCLEDAIQEEQLSAAEDNVLQLLIGLSDAVQEGRIAIGDIPLTFVRVRDPEQFGMLVDRMTPNQASVLSGFVFPKFSSRNRRHYFQRLEAANKELGETLYGMPILESPEIALVETRLEELGSVRSMLREYRHLVLNIRVGATDFSSVFGVRRGINYSIYDILAVRDCLSAILNTFIRADEDYTVSAPVWEYFLADKDENLKDLLKDDIHRSILRGQPIVNEAIDGLLREVVLDKANGFVGKTIIHPSHLRFVNSMQAVMAEEYEDAKQILATSGGVVKSTSANKMNEISPHRNWANRTIYRARAYGVVASEKSYLELMNSGGK